MIKNNLVSLFYELLNKITQNGVSEEVGSFTKAKELVDKRDPVAMRVFDRIASKELTKIENEINENKEKHTSDAASDKQSQEFCEKHQNEVTSDNVGESIIKKAAENNLTTEGVDEKQIKIKNKTENRFRTIRDENAQKIEESNQTIINKQNDAKAKIAGIEEH